MYHRTIGLLLMAIGGTLLVMPQMALAADGMDPRCDAPDNWLEDMSAERLMEVGWPAWFEACRPGMPPIWPQGHQAQAAAPSARGSNVRQGMAAPSTSAPGTLWDQPVADPLNNLVNVGNNLLNFAGSGDSSNFRVADDFFLDPNLLTAAGCQFEITQIRYSELDFDQPDQSPAGDYVLEIWKDGGGRPSGVTAADMAAGPFNANSSTFVGVSSFGSPIYELTWNFGPPLVLAPGTYWLSASLDAKGGTTGDTTTPIYGVASGAFNVQMCSTCVAWTQTAGNSQSLDFDIDGSVVCPPPPTAVPPTAVPGGPVGGFAVGDVTAGGSQPASMAPVNLASLPLIGLLLGLGAVLFGGVMWRRRS